MPKKVKSLSALEVNRIAKHGLYAVGGVSGLCLQVAAGGSRSWILRTHIGIKRRSIGLGGYPDVSLSQARDKARDIKDKISQGIDVILERQQLRQGLIAAQGARITFADAARRKHDTICHEFRNTSHSKEWISSLERYAFDVFADMDISDIELPHVLKVLEPIWRTKTETATRVRQRIETVLSWATVSGYRSGDNPARWAGNLSEVLASPSKVRTKTHLPALDWKDVPAFMIALRQHTGVATHALEFAILTASRSGEVRGMTWDELDLRAKIWTVDGSRMKAGKDHIVPLSPRAIEIINSQSRMYESQYVFASNRGGELSNTSMIAVCRRMEVEAVPHGFRSSFKDWARNRTSFPDEVSELALAHVSSDATRAAYARDALLPARAQLMDSWAQFCETSFAVGNVIDIRAVNRG